MPCSRSEGMDTIRTIKLWICGCPVISLVVIWLQLLVLSLGYNVHVTEYHQPGSVLYNASLQSGQVLYSLSARHKGNGVARQLIHVHPTTGVVSLLTSPDCSQITSNPISMHIAATMSKQDSRVVESLEPHLIREVSQPLTVYIHGNKDTCFKFRRKHPFATLDYSSHKSLLIQLILKNKSCLPRGMTLLFLPNFIPQTMSSECSVKYKSHTPVGFELDPVTGRLFATDFICLDTPIHVLKFKIQTVCHTDTEHQLFHIPIKISINSDLTDQDLQGYRGRSRRGAPLNHAPNFAEYTYTVSVPEEQSPGYVVASILATDTDIGEAGILEYSLEAMSDHRSQNMFTIDPSSGQISTTKKLDRETMFRHLFQIVATDKGSPPQQAITYLTINVQDVNDHTPVFEEREYSQAVSEDVHTGTTVLTVRASDGDFGSNKDIEYTILNPSGLNEAFYIERSSGSIVTKHALDRELNDFYSLEIQATDRAPVTERKSSTALVEITVLDENDNKPQFGMDSYSVEVKEDIDTNGGPVIMQVQAEDADAGGNGVVRYSITGGNLMSTFAIDDVTGKISVHRPLDYEGTRVFSLNIRAQDSGNPPRSNSKEVTIHVIDVNDNNPQFYSPTYREAVLENAYVGFTIMRVQALDKDSGDNGALTYHLIDVPNPDSFPLEVAEDTGVITTKDILDRERDARYSFKMEARDHGDPARTATTMVDVTIRDVNDNAPIFNPRIYSEDVAEDEIPGSAVVTVTAVDKDEGEHAHVTYEITSGNDDGAFSITNMMGQGLIMVGKYLDYNQQSRYVLTVTATDTGALVDTCTVFINVTDANTYRPRFEGTPYTVQIYENVAVGSTVLRVRASDLDSGENARVTYDLHDNSVFRMNTDTGDLVVNQALDREEKSAYIISVTASDHGRPVKSDTTDIEIGVLDINDNSPEFLKTIYMGEIGEDAVVGTSVLTISAIDKDHSRNGMIRYTFEEGDSGNGDFKLDMTLGIVRTASEMDRERISDYQLVAYAVDRGEDEKSTSVQILIKVTDVNDNAPVFQNVDLGGVIRLTIKENSPIDSSVGIVEAIDPDEGVFAEVEYSVIGGPDFDSFSLITRAGEPAVVTSLVELDYESSKKNYSIQVRARSFHLFDDIVVVIDVLDVNDNMPQLKDFTIIFNNYKNHFPTEGIGRIPASDLDVNDTLKYYFTGGNKANLLHLDQDTGIIKLDSRLNSDVPTNATLHVTVNDGINEVKATCRLFVRLVTEEMLNNSITVRLDAMDQRTFLSGLYDLLIVGLASIIPTPVHNVYIVNVQDDTDVPDQILNVSISVRRTTENRKDVFFTPQFLREQVYLHRMLLRKLATVQVLPFDDNLCMQEPCLNYEECVSTLKFGNASGFIDSDTVLFRPIYPLNTIRCLCPPGFAGMETDYLCDTEVNLCYSNPCGNHGDCQQREGGYSCHCEPGYTGDQCQLDMRREKYTLGCPAGVCKRPGYCAGLIRGGFRCEVCAGADPDSAEEFCQDCADLEHHTSFCELTARSFTKGSFVMFPSLKRRHRFNIRLSFSTMERNALLFYNGRYNEKHDFIALEIIEGQVQFSFSLGTDVTKVNPTVEGGVNDGQWHEVTVDYFNRSATVTVGEWCDTMLWVRHGQRLAEKHHCAARANQTLNTSCSDVTLLCHRFLDLTGPFQLGGIPNLPASFQVTNTHFEGCLRDVYIDNKLLDLNDYVYNNETEQGCSKKRSFCSSAPCQNNGVCYEAWNNYRCECPTGWGGRDCSEAIEDPWRLQGQGFLLYSDSKWPAIRLPWYNGVSFRTRQERSVLMTVEVASERPVKISMELVNGYVHYIHPLITIVLDKRRVNDGMWHYVEARWLSNGYLQLLLDYGLLQETVEIQAWLQGEAVSAVVVGGRTDAMSGRSYTSLGLVGCVENVRVGNSPSSILRVTQREVNATRGCDVGDKCDGSPCPDNAYCSDEWLHHTCICQPGYTGKNCAAVCTNYNPCSAGSKCKPSMSSSDGYVCECSKGTSGQYCEKRPSGTCPATWWGQPFCGPCNCPTDKGFSANCDKTTGKCYCKENHYQLAGDDTCHPCDCYLKGSVNASCDLLTGQCHCQGDVYGRKCDLCASAFAEVSNSGCHQLENECPLSRHSGINWHRAKLGETAKEKCPQGTSDGMARRVCDPIEGWKDPDLFNCTSTKFVLLKLNRQLVNIEHEESPLEVNTFVAKNLMTYLDSAVTGTEYLYGMDVLITYRLVRHVLVYENRQSGLNLTHKQDRNFLQNLVNSVGTILEPKYIGWWNVIHKRYPGTVELLYLLEKYLETLAENMRHIFTQPFDVVHPNMVLGLDYALKTNITEIKIPKFNNKVKKNNMFDNDSAIFISSLNLKDPSMKDLVTEMVEKKKPMAIVSYAMYRHLGALLPNTTDDTVRTAPVPQVINSAIFTVNVLDGETQLGENLRKPVSIKLKQKEVRNRTGPQCVFWQYKQDNIDKGITGRWSTSGCQVVKDFEVSSTQPTDITTCECEHMTSFAILSDVSDIEYTAVRIGMGTYVMVGVTLLILVMCFVLFCCIRGLGSNINSIHINLVFCIFSSYLVFIAGINTTDTDLLCKVIAILLHFFFLCIFAWMFVEALHLYRMLTEIRNIDQGSMRFYYTIGYVVPGIIVGLAVGLDTDGYGNDEFCWIKTSDMLVWSFAGPICIAVLLNIIIFVLTVKVSCHGKTADPEFSVLKNGVKAGVVLLPLLGMAWVFALLAANDRVIAFQYLFGVFTLLQALFILLAHIFFNKKARVEIKYQFYKVQGKKNIDESLSNTRTSMLSKSALAYHHNTSSLDGGLNRIHVGISTSTTSKSSSPPPSFYPQDRYLNSSSTSTNNGPNSKGYPHNAGIMPYGFDPSMFHEKPIGDPDTGEMMRKKKRLDSDSDSELSAMEHPDMELASSHTSDDDDDDYTWGGKLSKSHLSGPPPPHHHHHHHHPHSPASAGPHPVPAGPQHNTPAVPPLPPWPREDHPISPVRGSDVTLEHDRSPQINVTENPMPNNTNTTNTTTTTEGSRDRLLSPPKRIDSLPTSRHMDSGSDTRSPSNRVAVQVLTHNGSITSDSDSSSSPETVV